MRFGGAAVHFYAPSCAWGSHAGEARLGGAGSSGVARGIPILYLIAGDKIHVLAGTISKHKSVFNDHPDVMACRQTDSFNVQEVRDVVGSHRSQCLDEVANSFSALRRLRTSYVNYF